MGYNYTLNVINHANHSDTFMIFQNDPGSFSPNAMAVAWFTKFSNPGPNVKVTFHWDITWGFSWADTGVLGQGITFDASDLVLSEPNKNKITLDYNGAYTFTNREQGSDPSRLYIAETANIPINSSASVGVTMSGSTIYATQARPNTNLTFSPHPVYWIAYGSYQEGEVLDISTINNPLELLYSTGIYSLTTTLNADNSWTTPHVTAVHNARLLEARNKNSLLEARRMNGVSWADV